ncbi:partner of Y14 and mago-like [Actinidia eriantha]|uniref:partner of Y14 and mago-like n=1 Tax=Actinidia eriantha TaxID=165200 RepID=UPI00258A764C|nr:partner of Y14 and mago-like [Actinidia eriantha]XP_057493026.1 partner of Y14 and mago-like [Actinidia eriantha]XP_057493027.1 partner of Y14 and mago-like [Actinidia eriantha]
MAMASNGHGGGGEEEAKQLAAHLSKTLKEGERIVAPTRRADGTLRKPIRIRAGYVPQDEVAIYQSKGALWRKEMQSLQEVPPGYDLDSDVKPKTKAAKKNERKKEKRQQAALDKGKNLENNEPSAEDSCQETEAVKSVVSQMNDLSVSVNSAVVTPPSNSTQCPTPDPIPDIDKKIRALKKKIRLTEAQQQKTVQQDMKPEQLEKIEKLEGWRKELKLLEDRKAELVTS